MKGLPVAARGERVPLLTVGLVAGGVPVARPDAINELRSHVIALNGERGVGVRWIDFFL